MRKGRVMKIMGESRDKLSTKTERVLTILIILVVSIVSVILIVQQIERSKRQTPKSFTSSSASWVGLPGGDSERSAIENSSIIAKGTVVSQRTETRGPEGSELVFTISTVEIPTVFAVSTDDAVDVEPEIKGDNLIVDILQTGGTYGNLITEEIADAPILMNGKSYFLLLEKTDEGYYIPVGGRLGVAEVVKGEVGFVNEESREMFNDIEGEKVSEITDTLDEFVEDANIESKVNVNTDGDVPSAIIEEVSDDNE
jgi:hypothetical protein